MVEPSETGRSKRRKKDENKASARKLKETSLPVLSMLGTDSLSEHYHLELPSIESVKESVSRYKAFDFNLKEVKKSPRPQRLQPLRDHNGDVMSKQAIQLARRNLWQRSKFMEPVFISDSIKVKKDLLNSVSQKDRTKEKAEFTLDDPVEVIVLHVAKEMAIKFGIKDVERTDNSRMVDQALVHEIKQLSELYHRVSTPAAATELEPRGAMGDRLQDGFRQLLQKNLNEQLNKLVK